MKNYDKFCVFESISGSLTEDLTQRNSLWESVADICVEYPEHC